MDIKEFDFTLPSELIAQEPVEPRDRARLMVVDRKSSTIKHSQFNCLPDYLKKGDLLVFNDTKVFPARIEGKLETGSRVEILLVKNVEGNVWECLTKPAKKFKPGKVIFIENAGIEAQVVGYRGPGLRLLDFKCEGDLISILRKVGKVPLPPYIKKEFKNPERYQTVYAKKEGSTAAPTAGLHFTPGLLERIREKGIETVFVTLHIGPGTFKPISTERIENHKIHSEVYEVSREAAEKINNAISEGRRVIAVGTTVVRTLESAFQGGKIAPGSSETDLYIVPGYKFKVVDAMITNFHLPKSTLLVLVSAFARRELIMKAYQEAINKRYRFFSFGDAMLIL